MLVLNLPFNALMFLTLMRPSLVLFLVLWLKLVKDFLKVRCMLALLPFLISCLIWLDLVASLPLIKERILVIILLLHFLSLMLGSVLVLFFFSSRRRHTRFDCDWSSDVSLPILRLASARQPTFNCATMARVEWPAPRRTSAPAPTRSSLSSRPQGQAFRWRKWKSNSAILRFRDRKSTRLNSSHSQISYAVFCLKK